MSLHKDDPELDGLLHQLHESVQPLRRFLTTAIPMACGYFLAAMIYRQTNDAFWLLVSVLALIAVLGYLILFVFRGFRHRKMQPDIVVRPWMRVFDMLADNDVLFLVFTVLVPVAELILLDIGNNMAGGDQAMQWLRAAICVLYLAYLGVFFFVQGHRALALVVKAKEAELRRVKEQMDIMKRDNAIASQTHDTVTGGLSFIAFTAQKNMDLPGAEQEDWQNVNVAALTTLDNVHKVIAILGKPVRGQQDSRRAAEDGQSLEQLLTTTCATCDKRLEKLGFSGVSSVKNIPSMPASAQTGIVLLIEEIYTNISKYAQKEEPYRITILATADAITITQTNVVNTSAEKVGIPGSGMGLKLHTERIENEGGTVNSCMEDHEWTLYVRIPLRAKAGV